MVLISSAISLILLCSVHALPLAKPRSPSIIHAPLKHFRHGNAKDLTKASRSRARSPVSSGKSVAATNIVEAYTVSLNIGDQVFSSVLVDTGSSNTWIGASTQYIPSSTSQNTGAAVAVSYGSGNFSGTEFTDTVTLGDATVIAQSIGVANISAGFDGVDGIIGFGPVNLTVGTVDGAAQVPTFMQNLVSQGEIDANILGISFEPETGEDTDDVNGELTLGGIDPTKFVGDLTFLPLSQEFPTNLFWGVDNVSTIFGNTPLASPFSAIVDTGTTTIVVLDAVFQSLSSITDVTIDEETSLIVFATTPTDNITFSIGGIPFPLTPDQYLIPSVEYDILGLEQGPIFSWLQVLDDPTNPFPFGTLGFAFLEQYYSVFDTDHSVIGLAPRQ